MDADYIPRPEKYNRTSSGAGDNYEVKDQFKLSVPTKLSPMFETQWNQYPMNLQYKSEKKKNYMQLLEPANPALSPRHRLSPRSPRSRLIRQQEYMQQQQAQQAQPFWKQPYEEFSSQAYKLNYKHEAIPSRAGGAGEDGAGYGPTYYREHQEQERHYNPN